MDLYQLHHPDPWTPIDENLRARDDIVRAGKARYVGCSNYFAYQIARALGRSEYLGLARLECVQPRYDLLFRQVERELFPLCAGEGLGVLPYNPIAGGLLSGKHRRETGPMAGTRFTHPTAGARYRDRHWHERELETVAALRPLAAEAGMSMTQMAVAWVLENPVATAPIVGPAAPSSSTTRSPRSKGPRRKLEGATGRPHARVPLGRRHPLSPDAGHPLRVRPGEFEGGSPTQQQGAFYGSSRNPR